MARGNKDYDKVVRKQNKGGKSSARKKAVHKMVENIINGDTEAASKELKGYMQIVSRDLLLGEGSDKLDKVKSEMDDDSEMNDDSDEDMDDDSDEDMDDDDSEMNDDSDEDMDDDSDEDMDDDSDEDMDDDMDDDSGSDGNSSNVPPKKK